MSGITKKLLIFILVMSVVAVGGWFGRKAYKRSTERRLIAEAGQCLTTNDFRNAELCLRRAMQINPNSIPATKAIADMLERAGQPSTTDWRVRAAQLEPDNITNRFLWAETALKTGNLNSAEEALDGVSGPPSQTALFHKLSGALEWARHHAVEAERYYNEALRLEPGNPAIVLNLATIHLGSTNKTEAQAARASLEQLATNATWRLNALHNLTLDAIARKSLPDALEFSRQIVSEPKATFADQIGYLRLLGATTNSEFGPHLATLKEQASKSPAQAFALGYWMAMSQSPGEALNWLENLPPQTQTNQPVPLMVTDCKITLKDWPGLLTLVKRQNWGEAEFYRLAVESLAQRSLGKEYDAQAAWREGLRQSRHRLDRLARLAHVTASWNWTNENMEILQDITSEFPREKWAVNSLMTELYAAGDTRALLAFLTSRYAEDPSDTRVKNNLAIIYLLRKSDLDKAYQMAQEAFDSSPKNPFFVSTYAYSLLLQNKSDQALQVVNDLKPEYLQIPSIAAYYGVIQAQTGHKDLAKASLQRAEAARLLPEENEIVRLAKNGL